MAQHWPLLAGLIVLLGTNINLAGAGTCKPSTCSQSGGSGLFKYQAGNTYIYNLEGKTLTDLPEQQGEAVKIQLKAVAEVNFGADCTNTLKLRDVQITGPNAKVYGDLKELEAFPVRFSYNDGSVDPEICADADDSNTALNIKRAVISLLQVSAPQTATSKYEVDVFGSCATNFKFEVRGSDTIVTKSRNLNKCAHREDLRNRIPTSDYVTSSELQSAPILDSNLVVEVSVNGGVVKSAASHEIYLYRPFSNRDAGAKTVVHTSITFASKAAGSAHACKANAARSLIFDAPHSDSNARSSVPAIVSAMQACKASSSEAVQVSAATEFRHLVDVFRASNKNDLLAVYGQVKSGAGFQDKVAARKLFLDALFRAGNGDSVQAAVELLKAKEFSDNVARLWYMSFAFVRHATPASLSAAASVLDSPAAPLEAYLGVGSLAARYCGEHNCAAVPAFNELLLKISKPLIGGCKCSSFEQENKVIAALKGIENMKGVNEATAALVSACMVDKTVPARVRVAALETARSDSCQPLLKKASLELLSNTQEDSEIRIKAYLAAVQCPCGKCANTVKELLDKEPVNQVGSYIVSHLRNVRASTNPDRLQQKQHLSEIRTTRRFPFDVRKFSRNYEVSGLFDAVNVGSSVEADVIYSQQSYLPRSASLNLTADVFGHSVNLLEIGTRAQNLDRLFESFFGPKGYVNTRDAEDLFSTGKASLKGLKEKLSARFSKTFRAKRSIPTNALEAFRKTVYQPTEGKAMNLDLSVKMFGSTLAHSSYHGDGRDISCDKLIDKLFDKMDAGVSEAKSFNHVLKHNAIFYENEMQYPTGLGFPLKMTVSGSAAVSVKLDGKLDIQAIIKDPKNSHFQFEVVPSAAVELVGMMSVDAYAVEAGLKVSSNLHTATGVNVNVKSVEGTGLEASFGLPVKKQEIVNVRTEVLTSVRERGLVPKETPLGFNTKRKDFHGCFDQLSTYTGLTFCSDIGVPYEPVNSKAAFYPLNGPSKFLLTVESDDVQSYKFRAALSLKDENRRAVEILFDTPNSKTNRKVLLLVEALRKPNYELRLKFASPIKTLGAELIYVQNPTELSVAAKVTDDANEYFVKLCADITGAENHQTYSPSLEYRTPGQKSERLVAKGKGKGKAQKQTQASYRIEGTVVVDKEGDSRRYTFNSVNVILPIGTVAVNGWVAHDKTSVSSDLKLIQGNDNAVTVKGKVQYLSPSHFKVNGVVQASQYPDLGGSVDWEYYRQLGQLESLLVLVHGKDLSSKQACLTARISAKYQGTSRKDVDFSGEGTVTYPLMGVEGKITADVKPNGLEYGIEGAYEKYSALSRGHLKVGTTYPGDYDLQLEAKVLDNQAVFETRRDILSPTENKFYTRLEMVPGGKYELSAETVCQMETNHVVQKVKAALTMDKQPETYNLDYALEVTGNAIDGKFKVNHGSSDFVDAFAKINRGSSPSGSAKLCVLDQLDSSLEFSVEPTKGSINGVAKLLKLKRTLSTAGTLTIAGSNYAGSLDVLFDEADLKKKVRFETVSDIKANAVSSKNTLIVFGYKTLFNIKGDLTGSLTNGQLKGNADLTLPTKHYLTGSIDRVLHVKPGDTDGSWKLEVSVAEKQGAPARSLMIDAKAEKCDRQKVYFDVDFNMVYKDQQGKDVSYQVSGKHLPEGENRHIELLGKVQGSLLHMAPMAHVKVDLVNPLVSYLVKVHLAADSNLELVGKAQSGADGTIPYLVENAIELNLPTGELKNVKGNEAWSYIKGVNGAPCELKGTVTTSYNEGNTAKLDVEVKGGNDGGQGKLTLAMPKDELRVLKTVYVIGKGAGIDRELSVTSIYGQKEGSVQVKVKVPEDKKSFHVTVDGRTPMENYKNFAIVADSKRTDKSVESEATFTVNEKKAVVTNKYGLDWRSPIFEAGVTHTQGKSFIGFFFLPKEGSSSQFQSEIKYEHNGDTGYAKADVVFPSVHDFTVTLDLDSRRFKLNQVHLVVHNKPGVKGGKSISVTQTDAGQPTVNGKLDYTFKDGSDGSLFEAAGVLKVRGENRQAKIVLKKTVISSPAETGIEYSFSTSLGEQTIDSLFKQTTKEIRLMAKACQKAGTCGHADYCSKYNINGLDFSNEVTAEVDVTGLGMTTDIAFKRITEKNDKEFLHKVEFSSKDAQLFSFKVGFNDKASTVCLITPAREMAVDATYSLVSDPKNPRHYTYKYEGSAWLDRARKPETKATAFLEVDYQRTDDSVTVASEAKLTHPALGKEMLLKGKTTVGGRQLLDTRVEIDVFAKKGQKITVDGKVGKTQIASGYNVTSTWDIKSKGQNLDLVLDSHVAASTNLVGLGTVLIYSDAKGKKDVGFVVEAGLNSAYLYVKAPQDVLVDLYASNKWNNGLPSAEFALTLAGCKTVIGEAHTETGGRLLYTVYKKETPERKIMGETCVDLITKAHTRLDWITGADSKQLYSLGFELEEKIAPDVEFSFDNIKALISYLREDLKFFVDKAKDIGKRLEAETKGEVTLIADGLKKSQPNLKPLVTAYQEQLKAIRSEIIDDKNIKELADLVKQFAAPASEIFGQIAEIVAKVADKALTLFEELFNVIIGSLKRVTPRVTESCNKMFLAVTDAFNVLASRALDGLQAFVELCKKHEPEIKQVVTAIADVGREVYRAVGKTVSQICKEVKDLVSVICDQVKAMPIFPMIEERITDIKLQLKEVFPSDTVIRVLHEVTNGLKGTLPTQELRDLVECVSNYLEKVAKYQKIDHAAEYKKMYQKTIAAYKSVVLLIRAEREEQSGSPKSFLSSVWQFSLTTAFKIPRWASIHLSPLKYLRLENLPSLREIAATYLPRSIDPRDLVPPFKSYGLIMDTSHFFTFDKRHFTFAGSCSYLLAQDSTNGNFSLVLNLEKNKFKTLQLSDGEDTLEITSTKSLLLNGEAVEFPYQSGSLSAWREYHTISLKSSAGLRVTIDPERHLSLVELSGFYHGQVRGLLGDSNYEQYDDFRLPSGQICTDAAEFGNAYQVGGKCAPGTSIAHDHQHEAQCTTFFSNNSPLRPAFNYVDPEAFREACDHHVAETTTKKLEYACRIAAAYAQLAARSGKSVDLPNACASCSAPGKTINIGDILSLKAPSQRSDVVIVFEQVMFNLQIYNDLVVPLVASLTGDLKSKGITDVKFSLIGFGAPSQKWPAHHTTNGQLAYDGNCRLEFGDREEFPQEWGKTNDERWAYLKRRFLLEVGATKLSQAITEAARYPFRAGASKAILLVTGSPCEKGLPLGLQKLRSLYATKLAMDRGISVHVVSPMEGFNVVGNKDAKIKTIVGFDADTVYSLPDGKRKSLEGSGNADLRNEIEYKQDACIDITQTTNGAAYNANNFLAANANQRKQFQQVVVNKLVQALSKEVIEECQCVLSEGLYAEASCKVTEKKTSEPLKAQTETKSKKGGGGKKPKH